MIAITGIIVMVNRWLSPIILTNDLKKFGGNYYTPDDYSQIQQNISGSTNITGSLLNASSPEQMKNILNSNVGSYQQGVEEAAQDVEGISPTKKDF